jgi:acid stress-induced BolA-like protein IbaG/YrbA
MTTRLTVTPEKPEDVLAVLRASIEAAIEESRAEVSGGGGHYTLVVVSPSFDGKSRLESQRMVLRAIRHLMVGPSDPVHALDHFTTRVV